MKTTSFLMPSVGLGLVVVWPAIWPLAGPVPGNSTHVKRKETFEYYQDGKTGRGRRRVLVLDLGDGVKMEFVRVPAGTFLMGSPEDEKDLRGPES
jgi:formylglycine-generating enzyme required for sulfatase activity